MVGSSGQGVDKFVLPGEIVSSAEEYVPGRNVDEDGGNLISLVFGTVRKDDVNLVLSIDTKKRKIWPRNGDIVYGQVIKGDRGRFTVAVGALSIGKDELYELNLRGNLKMHGNSIVRWL